MSSPSDTHDARPQGLSGPATLLVSTPPDVSTSPDVAQEPDPTRIGRYRVARRLGAGGMGSVYEARDTDLDRPVALKLVRADLSERARQRMQREALALARLSHPHVVQIHEIGQAGGRTFIAMELVRGQTLQRWQQATPLPRWREALRLYAQAGEGLAAAHAEGLVHRDFKPSNCMLGDDGRVRVLDFGVAKGIEDDPPADTSSDAGYVEPTASALTRTGAMVGTPAYMAPEQLGREPVDASADQFGFCVALYEALYGQRPFAGQTLAELFTAVSVGRVEPASRQAAVPGWVRKVVLRGLAVAPAQRWPSMRALLDALADDPARRRRKRLAALGVVALAGGGAWGWIAAAQRDASACEGAQAKLAGAWDDERRAAVEQAVLGTGLSYAPATWERVQAHLDGYADAWARSREDACEATRRGEQSERLLDLRMACLDQRLLHLRSTVEELSRADAKLVERAVQTVLELPALARCEDVDALSAEVPPPEDPALAERVAELDARLVEVDVKIGAGKYDEASTLIAAVTAEAEQLGWEPLLARAWGWQGRMQDAKGEYEAAKVSLERAYDAAVAQQMTQEAAYASATLVSVLGLRLARPEEGRRWVVHADPLSRAAGDVARSSYLTNLGNLELAERQHEAAREHLEQALALREQTTGPEHPDVVVMLINLGNVAAEQGQLSLARERFERALAIVTKVLGPEHPDVAIIVGNLGNVAYLEGKPTVAREHLERALAIRAKAMGPDHASLAYTLGNLGSAVQAEGDLPKAREHIERALAIRTRTLGLSHPHVGLTLASLASVAHDEGKDAEAREHYERALAILIGALGPDHPNVAEVRDRLAELDAQPAAPPAPAPATRAP